MLERVKHIFYRNILSIIMDTLSLFRALLSCFTGERKIETRRFTPSVVVALKIAGYFAVPVETIFSLSQENAEGFIEG